MKKENMRAYLISGPGFFQRRSAWAFCRRRPRRCPCCSRCSCQRSGRAATGQSPGSSGRKADTLKDVRSDPPRPRPRSSLGLPCSALRMCPAKRRPRMRPQPPAASSLPSLPLAATVFIHERLHLPPRDASVAAAISACGQRLLCKLHN